jgi:TRAP-type uncharacterized transport system fused permease subunit
MEPLNVNKQDNDFRVVLFLNVSPAATQIMKHFLTVLVTVAALYLPNLKNLQGSVFSHPPIAMQGESKK